MNYFNVLVTNKGKTIIDEAFYDKEDADKLFGKLYTMIVNIIEPNIVQYTTTDIRFNEVVMKVVEMPITYQIIMDGRVVHTTFNNDKHIMVGEELLFSNPDSNIRMRTIPEKIS